jgi:hypothetical protein
VFSFVPLLAHIGSPDNPWIGVMTVAALMLLVVFALYLFRRIEIDAPGDLLLPMAAVVLVAGLTGSLGDAINDQGPWAVPAGIVVLVALLIAGFGSRDFVWGERPTYVVIALAVVAAIVLFNPLESLWFPEESDETLPPLEDGVVVAEVLAPPDESGTFTVLVTLENATFGDSTSFERPEDPETELVPRFQVGPVYLQPPIPDECAAAEVCIEAVFELTLPAGFVSDPPEQLTVELLTADQLPFAPPLLTRFELPSAG